MRNKKFLEILKGKGYYIALFLCAAAIGISGYLYYQNKEKTNNAQDSTPVISNDVANSDVQASATTPDESTPDASIPTEDGKKLGKVTRPVSGQTVLDYAMEALSYNPTTRDWRVHNGIDIAAETGTDVCAAADGIVYTVYEDETMGTTVVIRHNEGYVTKYASLAKDVSVSAGQSVSSGQKIGTVGCTALLETAIGDHLHFSVTCNGAVVDPNEFLEQS